MLLLPADRTWLVVPTAVTAAAAPDAKVENLTGWFAACAATVNRGVFEVASDIAAGDQPSPTHGTLCQSK